MTTIRSLDLICPSASSTQEVPSIHGLLAADIARDGLSTTWGAVLPSPQEMDVSFPLLWPLWLRDRLPSRVRRLVETQERRCREHWEASSMHDGTSLQEYTRAWLLVNSRTFYNETARTEMYPWEERLALVPIADLFNHSSVAGCAVGFSDESYIFTATKTHEPDDEVYISYGNHSNDFLLAEYGFVMDGWEEDSVCLDDVILPKLSGQGLVPHAGLVGGYAVGSTDGQPSDHRTRNMLRLLGGVGDDDEGATIILQELLSLTKTRIHDLTGRQDCPRQKQTALSSWMQMEAGLQRVLSKTLQR